MNQPRFIPKPRHPSNLWMCIVVVGLLCGSISGQQLHFDFGPTTTALGYKHVQSDTVYSKAAGYGFEPGANISCVERKVGSPAGFCTSDKPFYFSVAVPEGNYIVRITFGDFDKETRTTVKAELRRFDA